VPNKDRVLDSNPPLIETSESDMAEALIEIDLGTAKFRAEGSEQWVDGKLESFLKQLDDWKALTQNPRRSGGHNPSGIPTRTNVGPLAIFLKELNVGSSQNNRFLATAVWLKRNGQMEIKTADIVKALSEAHQQRLGNPADILNKNVKKGFCVKNNDGFYITTEGEESLNKSS